MKVPFHFTTSSTAKGYSCQSLLVKCIDNWKNALDKPMFIGTLFMDLTKAFDCLPHSLVIAKLRVYGLELPACKLLFSYLRGRKQRVKISNSRRSWAVSTKGVPQGSILGPLLFNIFMNDLFLFIEKCQLYNYADDNSLDSSSENVTEVLSNLRCDGRNAIEWFANNGMQANPDKFHFNAVFSHAYSTASLVNTWRHVSHVWGWGKGPGCDYWP